MLQEKVALTFAEDSMRASWAIRTAIALGTVAAAAATISAATSGTGAGAPAARLQANGTGPAQLAEADRAAVTFATTHYPGPGTAQVLATEPDTEHGKPVYDVRVLAPNRKTYVVHVSRPTGTVLSASLSESQPTAQPAKTSADPQQEKKASEQKQGNRSRDSITAAGPER